MPSRSGAVRTFEQRTVLEQFNPRCVAVSLSGYIFFGSSVKISDKVMEVIGLVQRTCNTHARTHARTHSWISGSSSCTELVLFCAMHERVAVMSPQSAGCPLPGSKMAVKLADRCYKHIRLADALHTKPVSVSMCVCVRVCMHACVHVWRPPGSRQASIMCCMIAQSREPHLAFLSTA